MLTRKNAKAYAVLAIIASECSDEEWQNFCIEPYLNGRENGFAIHFWFGEPNRKFVFSENRSSDSIVVYEGTRSDFNMLGNGLTEEIYRDSRFFGADEYYQAAKHILERLRPKND